MKKTIAALALTALAACTIQTTTTNAPPADPHPTDTAAAQEAGGAICDLLAKCFLGAFQAAYPNGRDQCVQKATTHTDGGVDGCTQSQVDTCTADIQKLSCPTSPDKIAQPDSCKGC